MTKLFKLRGLSVVPQKIVIKSQKGGVGGSTITLQTAIRIAETRGVKVLIIDTDPEASSTSFLLPEEEIFSGNLKTLLDVFQNKIPLSDCIVNTKFDGVYLVPSKGNLRRIDRIISRDNPKNIM